MQERKKYTVELTAEQFDKFQTLITLDNCTRDIVFEEVKEEVKIDEREETIKSIKCYMQNCNKELENCPSCHYNSSLTQHRVNEIALKHIQGYKKFKEEWLDLLICDEPTSDFLKGYYKAIADVRKRMIEDFDISEVDNGTEID